MAFHIDRGCPRLRMQRGLAGPGGNHLLDAGQIAPLTIAAGASARRWRSSPRSAPMPARQPRVAGQHLGRHHDVA